MNHTFRLFQREWSICRQQVEAALEENLTAVLPTNSPFRQPIYDCVLNGGKRLRPILMLKMAELLGQSNQSVLKAACAIEILHSVSLVLDDLPAMDNATVRRGQPTAHLMYGEANVILLAHLLAFQAYDLIVQNSVANGRSPQQIAQISTSLVQLTGLQGVIGGQVDDLAEARDNFSKREMEEMYYKKTGALLVLTAVLTGQLCQANPKEAKALVTYARHLGIAYQIRDDILDETGELHELGKNPRQDVQKQTHTKLAGLSASQTRLKQHLHKAEQSIAHFGPRAWFLTCLCQQYGALN
ncbi:MAG: polyprenyl synthetase family protein [Ardenticatenaceae bacterium]|nr:polyprenyl synthetase family protein [Ardenticatenaceae bacterium]